MWRADETALLALTQEQMCYNLLLLIVRALENIMNIFVIMPFDSEFNLIYRHLIKKPLEAHGDYEVSRADDNPDSQNLLEEIIQGIANADLIIADLTGHNSNVYYELGIAHASGKNTIQIVQSISDIQFNLTSYNTERYEVQSDGSSDLVSKLLAIIEKPNYKFKNPVTDYSVSERTQSVNVPDTLDESGESIQEGSHDTDYGILDARADAHDAMEEIVAITKGIGSDIADIGDKTAQHSDRINELGSGSNQGKTHRKVLKVLRQFASDVDSFSDSINSSVPRLRESWTTLDQGLGHELVNSDLESESDYEEAIELISNLVNMRTEQTTAITSIQGFREAQRGLIGLSKVSNPALRNSIKSVDNLIEELELGNSVVSRLIHLTEAMVDRYSGNNLDNGNDSENDNAT